MFVGCSWFSFVMDVGLVDSFLSDVSEVLFNSVLAHFLVGGVLDKGFDA